MADYLLVFPFHLSTISIVASQFGASVHFFFFYSSNTCVSTIWNHWSNAINLSVKFRRAIFYNVLLCLMQTMRLHWTIDFAMLCQAHQKQCLKMVDRCGTQKKKKKKWANITSRTSVKLVCNMKVFWEYIHFGILNLNWRKISLATINCFRWKKIVERQTIFMHFRFALILFA